MGKAAAVMAKAAARAAAEKEDAEGAAVEKALAEEAAVDVEVKQPHEKLQLQQVEKQFLVPKVTKSLW